MPTNVTWGNPTVQWGNSSGGGPTWTTLAFGDGTGIFNLDERALPVRGGAIVDARNHQTLRFDAGGTLLDGPIVTTVTLRATFARTTAFEGGGTDNRVQVWVVPDPRPVDFSNTAIPLTRGEVSLGIFTLALGDIALIPFTVNLVLPGVDLRSHVTSRARWQGRLALVLTAPGSVVQVRNGPTNPLQLLTVQEPFFSGLAGGPTGARQRVVRDGRFGMPALNTELVRDGENPALFVRAEDWDPEDEPARYRPRPGEGTVDDDVPNL